MTLRATGRFEVKLVRQTQDGEFDDPSLARLSIDKRFEGDLQGTSRGQMMSARTGVENSAGYVALERVSGTLHGRSGTFMLQHSSTLARGVAVQSITVVPDSGSGELVGLEGRMTIHIVDGKHFYELESTLPKDF
ncbi:MAG TPA: DUF3224 domain-containing protein [Meiothermus sp.]|nr:DUF3224 domain-containing protein [Meiothermus sp.]